jgi:NADH-quinone oxidoreductase subunit M
MMAFGWSVGWLAALPFGGAVVAGTLWGRPWALKHWALAVSLVTLVGGIAPAGRSGGLATDVVLLLPAGACFSLMGERLHDTGRHACLLTLVLLGLGLAAGAEQEGSQPILLTLLCGLLGALVWHGWQGSDSVPWWGIGTYGIGALGGLLAAIARPPVSTMGLLVSSAVLLPLGPLHTGFVEALRRLPGNLPAFVALALPVLGWQSLAGLLPHLPATVLYGIAVLALGGMLYGALKAVAQTRIPHLVAYASLSFFSILWWNAALTRTMAVPTALFVVAVGLVVSGWLLVWKALEARFGDIDVRAIRGLAHTMPRLSLLWFLLTLAAIGLPPFGLFTGLMGLLVEPALPFGGALLVIACGWLPASWYFLGMSQRLIFGPHRSHPLARDLSVGEAVPLLGILLLLVVLGLLPGGLSVSGAAFFPPHLAKVYGSGNQ